MSYRPIKKQLRNKINISQVDDFDLYFEKIPPTTAYKLRRVMNRNMRKLKLA